jgi:hypothetical protein
MYTLSGDVCVVVVPTLVYAIVVYVLGQNKQSIYDNNSVCTERKLANVPGTVLPYIKFFPVWNLPVWDVSVTNWD